MLDSPIFPGTKTRRNRFNTRHAKLQTVGVRETRKQMVVVMVSAVRPAFLRRRGGFLLRLLCDDDDRVLEP